MNSIDNLDMKEYKEQLEYYKKYYGSEFKKNQGTEYLLDVINSNIKEGTLIDFGSGSNIYFWLLAMNKIKNVTCVDISKEAFYINREIKDGHLYPRSYDYPIYKYNKILKEVFEIPIDYIIFDVLKNDISEDLEDATYDNVTQFGLLGLCKNKEEYIKNFQKLWQCLKTNGTFVGANWLFSKKYSIEKGYSNEYLSISLIKELANILNAKINYLNLIPIEKDENYDYVLIYSLNK